MSLSVRLWRRDHSGPWAPHVQWEVRRLAHAALGGPDTAEIAATGRVEALWSLADTLRCPVEIVDERGEAAWWGYVAAVEFRVGALEVGVSLAGMANRIRLFYQDASGEERVTPWAEDAGSIAAFGVHEWVERLAGAPTAAQASAQRDTLLAARRYPVPTIASGEPSSAASARVLCHGWWRSLAWRRWEQPAGLEQFVEERGTYVHLGDSAASQKVAQAVTLSTPLPVHATAVELRVQKEGAPADDLTVTLCADEGGSPGAPLGAAAALPALSLSDRLRWQSWTFPSALPLAAGTPYWIVAERSGPVHASDYYGICLNEESGHAGGPLRLYNGSAWLARVPDGRALFRLHSARSLSDQIRDIAAGADTLTGLELEAGSDYLSSPYRDGGASLLSELRALLAAGSGSQRRLLATVTRERRLRVYEAPAPGERDAFLLSSGTLQSPFGQPIPAHHSPVGQWARLKEIIPATHNPGLMANPGQLFIERSDYDAASRVLRLNG